MNISATGAGYAYASSCEYLTREWLSTSSDWFSTNKFSSIAVNTMVFSETLYSVDVVPMTLTSCLGHSRELGGQTLAQSPTGVDVSTMLYSYLTAVAPSYTVPAPACTFDTAGCNLLWDEYDAYNSLRASVWPAAPTAKSVSEPLCQPDRPGAYCDKCTISGNFADVYYWPPVVVGEPCDLDRSFITATPTIPGRPNTVVFGTNTFTSPTVYLSIDYLAAASDYHGCGRAFSSTFLPLDPEQVSSIRFSMIDNGNTTDYFTFEEGTTTVYETMTMKNFTIAPTASVPVNFADFMGAVPAAAWNAQYWQAYSTGMGLMTDAVISDASYSPQIVLPEQVRSMDPLWSNCEIHINGISDPPVALSAASSIVVPELPTFTTTIDVPGPSGTPAEPAGLPGTSHASSTQVGVVTSQSRSSRVAGAAETGGSAQPSRTTTRVGSLSQIPLPNPLPDGHLSYSSSPQDHAPAVVSPMPDNAGSENSDLSSNLGTLVTRPSESSSRKGESMVGAQQITTRVATSRQAPMTITLNGSRLPVVQSGSIAIVGERTLTVGGAAAMIQGQQISLEPSGLRVASSETVRFPPASTLVPQPTAVWDDGDVRVTIAKANNAISLTSEMGTVSIAVGGSGIVNGHRVDVPPAGDMIVVDGSEAITLGPKLAASAASVQLSLATGERSVTVEKLGNNRILLTSASESVTIANGAETGFAGATFVVLADGSGVVVTDMSLIPWSDTREELQGDMFSAMSSGDYVLISHGTSNAILADNSVTIIDGHTISAAADGGYIVVDGSITQPVASSPTQYLEGEGEGEGEGKGEGEGSRNVEEADATRAAIASGAVQDLILTRCAWKILALGVLVGLVLV